MPAICPRIRLRLTETPRPDDDRVAGEGSLDQVHRDLAELEEMGCSYVVLDNYFDDPDALRHHQTSSRMPTAPSGSNTLTAIPATPLAINDSMIWRCSAAVPRPGT